MPVYDSSLVIGDSFVISHQALVIYDDTQHLCGAVQLALDRCADVRHDLSGSRNRLLDILIGMRGGDEKSLVLTARHVHLTFDQSPEILGKAICIALTRTIPIVD